MKKIDKLIINVTVYAILLLLSFAVARNFAAAVFIAFLLWITVNRLAVHLLNRRKDKKQTTITQMEDALALMGISGQTELFIKATPPCFEPTALECGFEATLNCEKIAVFPNYKFSPCNPEEIAKFYRMAKERGIKTVWILSRLNPRSVVLFAGNLEIDFQFKTSRSVRRFLYNRNMLPEKIRKSAKKKAPVKWKELFSGIFIRRRAKYFLFAGLSLAFLSIFGPLKILYIVMSALTLVMGLVCLIRESV